MDPLRYLVDRFGFFTRAEAAGLGYDDRAVTAAVRSGAWHRIRRGSYTFGDVWRALDPVGQHLVRTRAVARSLDGRVALSHVTAALVHGVDVWGVDLDRVHVTRLDGGPGRIEGDVVHHEGFCLDDDVIEVGGLRVLRPERSVLEAASRVGGEAALVMLDSLLHRRIGSPDRLWATYEVLQHWPYMRRVHIPLRMADAGAESPGESRGRWLCWAFRLPAPVTQFEVRDRDGELIGTTDFAWPAHDGLGEFDGRLKYGRSLRPGQDPGEVVFAEKQREDRIREATGMAMIRLVWSDYDRPRLTAGRIERMLRRSA